MTTATTVLDAQGLTKALDGTEVLQGLDLQVRDGEYVSVMGPSGSGKSTRLYSISGMDNLTAGSVVFRRQGRRPHLSGPVRGRRTYRR